MARLHGKDLASCSVHSQDMLADTLAINFKVSAKTHDVTTMGEDWVKQIAGLKGGDTFDHEMFYDNTNTTGTWAKYTSILGAAAGTFSFGDGTRTVSMSTIVVGLSLPITVGDMVKLTATHQITGIVTFS